MNSDWNEKQENNKTAQTTDLQHRVMGLRLEWN